MDDGQWSIVGVMVVELLLERDHRCILCYGNMEVSGIGGSVGIYRGLVLGYYVRSKIGGTDGIYIG